jgi:uncharacterized protein YydD (DUF2326 family)
MIEIYIWLLLLTAGVVNALGKAYSDEWEERDLELSNWVYRQKKEIDELKSHTGQTPKLQSKVDILQGRIDEMEEGDIEDILLERIEGLEKYLKIEGEYTEPEESKFIYKKK